MFQLTSLLTWVRWMYKQEDSNGERLLRVCFAVELKSLYKSSSCVISFWAIFSSEQMIYWRRRLSRCHVSSGLLLQAPRNHSCFILSINHIIWNHLCTVHILCFSTKKQEQKIIFHKQLQLFMHNMFRYIALTSTDVFTDILTHSLKENKTVAGFYFGWEFA